MIARSTLWGTVQLGEKFYHLPEAEQRAVILHEFGHIYHRHSLKRLLWLISLRALFQTEKFFAMCKAQEYEADQYAAARGMAHGLIAFLMRRPLDGGLGHPLNIERIEALNG